jgi:flavin reductase (DIM6/NTAB) family NADH-FMN oxidoreductase RutF
MTAASEGAPGVSSAPDAASFREAMARIASTVHVLTTVSRGQRYGITLTAACSLAADPFSVLVSVNRSASIYAPILRAGQLCLNILGADHAPIAARFAGSTGVIGEDRFDEGAWRDSSHGLPMLADAVASLDCTVASTMSLGTHTVFGCLVREIALHDAAAPLLYANRAYSRALHHPLSGVAQAGAAA